MTTHACTYETLSSRNSAGAGSRPDLAYAHTFQIADVSVALQEILPRPLIPLSGYGSDVPYASVDLVVEGDTDISYRSFRGTDFVTVGGVETDNTAEFVVRSAGNLYNSGTLSPRPQLNFSGVALPVNGAAAQGQITYSYGPENLYSGLTHFCDFQDDPPGTPADGSVRLKALLEQFSQSGSEAQVGVDGNGTAIKVANCGFAGIAPEGAVMITPSDIGSNADQIPSSISNNTAAAFRAHPSVFYPAGKTPYVRSIGRGAYSTSSITNAGGNGGPLEITSIIAAPTETNWLIVVDGVAQVVRLSHPVGSDIRRPRDIWNQLWVPILKGSSNVQSATNFVSVTGNGGAIGGRWAYADYFRCLPIAGTNVIQSGIA
jgi:hypothetical protein